jgi:hypothetical protein
MKKAASEVVLFRSAQKMEEDPRFLNASESYADSDFFRGLVQLIPYAGGSLDTWMLSEARQREKMRAEEFIRSTQDEFERLDETKIDTEFLESEEFYLLFKRILIQAMQSEESEKIKILSRALANCAIGEAGGIVRDSYLEVIGRLSAAHVVVLKTLVGKEPKDYYIWSDDNGAQGGGFMHASIYWIKSNHPELSNLPLEIICADLARYDLLNWERVGAFGNDEDIRQGGARGYRPSSFGRNLIEFLKDSSTPATDDTVTSD